MSNCPLCSGEFNPRARRGRPRKYCEECSPPAGPLPPSKRRRGDVPPGCPLTFNELRAVRLLAEGLTYQQIALRIGRTVSTVRQQLHTAYLRLGLSDRAHVVLKCINEGWLVDVPPPKPKVKAEDRVTPVQALYLDAFVRFIRSGSEADCREMGCLTDAMFYEKRLIPPSLRPERHEQSLRTTFPEAA